MELVQWQMQSIHDLAIHSPWIQQKRPVEFDGFGIMLDSLGYVQYWIHPNQAKPGGG